MAGGLALLYTRVTRADAVVLALGFGAAAVAGAGVAWWQVAWLGEARARAFTFHPNVAAAAFVAAAGGILAGWRAPNPARSGSTARRIALLAALAAAVLGLALTGSRGGILGAAAGAALGALAALARARRRTVAVVALSAVVAAGALVLGNRWLAGPPSRNLLTNSGFEHGLLPWAVNDASQRVTGQGRPSARSTSGEGAALRLRRSEGGSATLARTNATVPVEPGEPYTLSLYARPEAAPAHGDATGTATGTTIGAVIVLEALGSDGTVVATLATSGWTDGPVYRAGGYPAAPEDPPSAWQRVTVAVPPLPAGAIRLRLTLQAKGAGAGAYGLVDDVQLERGARATAYVPGRRPGLATLLRPVTARLETLRDPEAVAGGRLGMWQLGLELAAARPVLGYGPGSEVRPGGARGRAHAAPPAPLPQPLPQAPAGGRRRVHLGAGGLAGARGPRAGGGRVARPGGRDGGRRDRGGAARAERLRPRAGAAERAGERVVGARAVAQEPHPR